MRWPEVALIRTSRSGAAQSDRPTLPTPRQEDLLFFVCHFELRMSSIRKPMSLCDGILLHARWKTITESQTT